MVDETKIERRVDIGEFLGSIRDYNEDQIECTDHTFFRLSEKQSKIFNCGELRRILTKERPFLVGIQYNQNHAIFYKYQDKNLKMILSIENTKIKIVTFYFIQEWQIPKI